MSAPGRRPAACSARLAAIVGVKLNQAPGHGSHVGTDPQADLAGRLQRLGVPPTAARAYLALLDLGETEARDVARVSGIRFAKVYAALDQLHARGLATVVLDTPRRYAPRPIDEYLTGLRRAQEEQIRALDAERVELAALLEIRGGAHADDRGSFTLVRGRRGTVKKVVHLLRGAREEVFILASEGFPSRLHVGGRLLDEAKARGVSMRILAPAAHRSRLPEALAGAEVRVMRPEPGAEHVAMLLADRARALLVQLVPDDGDVSQGHDVGLFTSQAALVLSLHHLLEARWDASEPARPSLVVS